MGLGKYLYEYLKEHKEMTYEDLESICKGNNPMNKWFKTDTGRRALNDYSDIKPKIKPGSNYIYKWVYEPEKALESQNKASKGIWEIPEDKVKEVNIGRLDWDSAKKVIEQKKQADFFNQ